MNELKQDLRHFFILHLWYHDFFLYCSLTYLISPFSPWLSGRQKFKIKWSYFSKCFTSRECLWAGAAGWSRQQCVGFPKRASKGQLEPPECATRDFGWSFKPSNCWFTQGFPAYNRMLPQTNTRDLRACHFPPFPKEAPPWGGQAGSSDITAGGQCLRSLSWGPPGTAWGWHSGSHPQHTSSPHQTQPLPLRTTEAEWEMSSWDVAIPGTMRTSNP